ncbi:MAG: extracellular solute-binding protein, partial [Pseudomonadota bacterium]
YDLEDIIPAYLKGISTHRQDNKTHIYGVPSGGETSLLAYRKDILAKYQIQPAHNYEELKDHIAFFARKEPDLIPLGMRTGAGHSVTHGWLLHFAPYGGVFFDQNHTPTIQTKAGREALDFIKLCVQNGSVGMGAWGFGNVLDNFLQGKMIYYLDSIALFGQLMNKNRSTLAEKVGFAKHPYAEKYSGQLGGFGLAIPKNAKHKDNAFKLMQWLTSKKNDLKIALRGGSASRISTLNNPLLLEKVKGYATIRDFIPYINAEWRPNIPEWSNISQRILGVKLSRAIIKDIPSEEALGMAQADIKSFMQKSGYYL